jgi:hypothetical protein
MSDTIRSVIFIILGELFIAMFGFLEARRGARTFWIVSGVLLLPLLTIPVHGLWPYAFAITAILPGWLFGGLLAYLVNKSPARPR